MRWRSHFILCSGNDQVKRQRRGAGMAPSPISISLVVVVPTKRAQGCGQPIEIACNARPVLGFPRVPKEWALRSTSLTR